MADALTELRGKIADTIAAYERQKSVSPFMEELLALCDRAIKEREWQPIETAPKDQAVLVWLPGAATGLEMEIGYCSSSDPDGDWYPSTHVGFPIDIPPTHWMPLPKDPTS